MVFSLGVGVEVGEFGRSLAKMVLLTLLAAGFSVRTL